ncbi:MAG: Fic family protein, partial [Terriglobia bacterium]
VEATDRFGHKVEVPLIKGDWKTLPNNPTRPNSLIHEYCPPEQVTSEMDRLVKLHAKQASNGLPPDIMAAWLHHRFTQIHPFQDGNGRVARTLASLVFLREQWFPLVVHRDNREEYIRALEKADENDLRPLVDLFGRIEKRAFLKAISISEDLLIEQEQIDEVLTAAAERLKLRRAEQLKKLQAVFEISRSLEDHALNYMDELSREVSRTLWQVSSNYFCVAERSSAATDFWFRRQIIECAKRLDYFADTRTYRAWVRLKIKEERQTEIIVSFHSIGVDFLGIMAASAFAQYRDRSEEDSEASIEGPYPLSDDVFQFAYNEKRDVVMERFRHWLRGALLVGLEQWRKQI